MALIQPDIVDEYGFIIMSEESKQQRRTEMRRDHFRYGGGFRGRGLSKCKHLCSLLPHTDGKQISFRRMGLYYCKDCECVMKCIRCRCCGNLGRSEPRTRNKDNVKRIE